MVPQVPVSHTSWSSLFLRYSAPFLSFGRWFLPFYQRTLYTPKGVTSVYQIVDSSIISVVQLTSPTKFTYASIWKGERFHLVCTDNYGTCLDKIHGYLLPHHDGTSIHIITYLPPRTLIAPIVVAINFALYCVWISVLSADSLPTSNMAFSLLIDIVYGLFSVVRIPLSLWFLLTVVCFQAEARYRVTDLVARLDSSLETQMEIDVKGEKLR